MLNKSVLTYSSVEKFKTRGEVIADVEVPNSTQTKIIIPPKLDGYGFISRNYPMDNMTLRQHITRDKFIETIETINEMVNRIYQIKRLEDTTDFIPKYYKTVLYMTPAIFIVLI